MLVKKCFYLFSFVFALVFVQGICDIQKVNEDIDILYYRPNYCLFLKNHLNDKKINLTNNICFIESMELCYPKNNLWVDIF